MVQWFDWTPASRAYRQGRGVTRRRVENSGSGRPSARASAFGQEKRQLQSLAGIEARIAMRVVADAEQSVSLIAWAPPTHSVTSWPVISK